MFTIGNDELKKAQPLGDTVKCKVCGELHNVDYGDIIKKDGSREKSKLLAFIKCHVNDECYLVGIEGKEI